MYSNTVFEFEQHLQNFEVVCVDILSFINYVHQTWLTSYKEKFVVAWTNKVTLLGNTTTNIHIL